MSTSVCVCVCVCVRLSVREDISEATRAIATNCFMHVACGRGSVLLRQGNEISREGAVLGGFFPIDNALYKIASGTHKND